MGFHSHHSTNSNSRLSRHCGARVRSEHLSVRPVSVMDQRHIVPQAFGDVVEIGMAGGANLGFYRRELVSSLVGVDPKAKPLKIAERASHLSLDVQVVSSMLERAALPDETADSVVSTHTLCAAVDAEAMLAAIYRLLRPGGRLLFCERGRHHRPVVAKFQDAVNPVFSFVAGGCQINRNMFRLIEQAGFHIDILETGAPRYSSEALGYLYTGIALKV